jgi:5-methyltetrahydropteroyltriglutamate--homocysteine methyltransferase
MRPMYRADQVGSFLRPQRLLEVSAAYDAGSATQDELRKIEDAAIDAILQLQRDVGIEVVSDGEFRRANFLSEMSASVEGFEPRPITITSPFYGSGQSSRVVVVAKLHQTRRMAEVEADYLLKHAQAPFKITLPTPFQFVNYMPGVTDQFYATRAELLTDLAWIVAGEIRALLEQGVKYVQIDAPRYSYFIDPKLADEFRGSGTDPGLTLEDVIAADNACLGFEHAPDVTTALHVCRGNNRSRWYAEGGYDVIAEQVFGSVQADRFLLEYDDERSGGFEPLRFVPPGRGPGAGHDQVRADGVEGRSVSTDRRGGQVRSARAAGAEPAVRVRVRPAGEPAERG